MLRPDTRFWIGLAVSLLGLAVGASNLMRGADDGSGTRNIVLGGVCIVLATGWLVRLLLRLRHDTRIQDT